MTTSSSIWTVSTIGIHANQRDVSARTWGYYFTRDDAIRGLMRSVDTEAGYYTHAVIEQFEPGIYALAESEEWFSWGRDETEWKSCSKPESERQIINYGMG